MICQTEVNTEPFPKIVDLRKAISLSYVFLPFENGTGSGMGLIEEEPVSRNWNFSTWEK